MAAQYGLRTKDEASIVTLDTTTVAIRSIKTVTVKGNGAWDQYFNIPEITAGSFVVMATSATGQYASTPDAWWTPGRLHLRRAGTGTWQVLIMSSGGSPPAGVRYGIRTRNNDLVTQIDNENRVLTVSSSGSFFLGRRGPGNYVMSQNIAFPAKVTSQEKPLIFLNSDDYLMVSGFYVLGSPGNWAGFHLDYWPGHNGAAAFTVKWMCGDFSRLISASGYGARVKDEEGRVIFTTTENIILLNGSPTSNGFTVRGDPLSSQTQYWSSFQMNWTGNSADYVLANSLMNDVQYPGGSTPFYQSPAGFLPGRRDVLQAYSGADNQTQPSGVNGRTVLAGRPMRPL